MAERNEEHPPNRVATVRWGDRLAFVSDLTVRGKLAIADAGAVETAAVTPANVT